jgi:glycosyltransferase involved in cell wall biosynthesis
MQELLASRDLRKQLAENAFAEVNQKYDWGRIAEDFAKLYLQVQQSHHNRGSDPQRLTSS